MSQKYNINSPNGGRRIMDKILPSPIGSNTKLLASQPDSPVSQSSKHTLHVASLPLHLRIKNFSCKGNNTFLV